MGLMRRSLLAISRSASLRQRAPRYPFVRRTVSRFMPGERAEDAIAAARTLAAAGLRVALTHLGENVTERAEAQAITEQYLRVFEELRAAALSADISLKLTQLGLDIDPEFCSANLAHLLDAAPADNTVWLDMEQSPYVDSTLEIFRRARTDLQANRNRPQKVGACIQAYLYRSEPDIAALIASGATVRLVKGAYNEPSEIAFPRKADVDETYFYLAQMLLGANARAAGVRAVFATHDRTLIARIAAWAASQGIPNGQIEFQMLFGIQRAEQLRLAQAGYRSGVLIAYGSFWFPWFMRRLAERPANVLFLARNFFAR
ncbi:MAG: proline dehydrogenase family protein [Candidatus Acidiferrales bacterium]